MAIQAAPQARPRVPVPPRGDRAPTGSGADLNARYRTPWFVQRAAFDGASAVAERMELRVLGPVEVRLDGELLGLGGPRQRTVLGMLLLRAGEVVSVDALVDELWGESPPASAVTQVQGYVSELRRLFRAAGDERQWIVTRPPGYLLQAEPGQVDVQVFERQAGQASRALAEGRLQEAADSFWAALALWRGPALGGIGDRLKPEATRLEEWRLAVLEQRIEADLALGGLGDLVTELTGLVAAHPLRERLRAQLMVALYRAGRQADALAVYRDGRSVLAEELGLDPGPELQRLEQTILSADASLDGPPAVSTTPAAGGQPAACVPRQLPPDIGDFTGRAKHVDAVCALLRDGREDGGCPAALVVSAITGKAGVGKTTLAVHAAHRLSDTFPDGQLFVNLRGAELHPVDPAEVLFRFLRALGVDGAAVPESMEERVKWYRSRLSGRRMLVVLDNATSEAQVRPLLPGSPSCAVLVTSRARLAGVEGANSVNLDILEPDLALELLGRLAGPERLAAEPEAAEAIVQLCGCLPLAVRIAGARLAARPHWTLARLANRLTGEQHRLDELRLGDLEVRASVALSYNGLDPDVRCTLRLLGLLDAPDVAAWVAAALHDVPLDRAEALIDELVDAQLLDVAGEDATGQVRYRLHDLIRVYARERATADDLPAERRTALERVLGAWLALTDEAATRMPSGMPRQERGTGARWRLDARVVDLLLAHPRAWFDAEQPSLVHAVEQASALELDEIAWDLAASLASGPLVVGGQVDDWWRTHQAALAATRRAGNRRGEAVVLCDLGLLHSRQDRFDEADDHYRQALAAFRATGSPRGAAVTLYRLGNVRETQGRFPEAMTSLTASLRVFERLGDRHAVACVSCGLGRLLHDQGRYQEALAHLRPALDTFRAAGDRRGEANVLRWIGLAQVDQQHVAEGCELLEQSLRLFREIGDRMGQAYGTVVLAEAQIANGKSGLAEASLQACLEVFRDGGDRFGEALVLCTVAKLHFAGGVFDQARVCLHRALRLWDELKLPLWRARTLRRLAELHTAEGNRGGAQAARREAALLQQASALRAGHVTS